MNARLDQLRFPDETKVGLSLLVAYMLLDSTQSFTLGGGLIVQWVTGREPGRAETGALQLLMLVSLSIVLMVWRVRRSVKGLELRRVEDVDAKAASETEYLGSRIAQGRAKFYFTGNMGDTNAFCLWTAGAPWVVLGGGLRLLFRKSAARARAIVGHECAHVDAGDTQYVLVAWHVFNAYVLLTLFNLVIWQGIFWMRVPQALETYHQSGLGLIDFLRDNGRYIFRGGFPGLIALVGLALTLNHLVRLREYRADERAAQVGLRTALSETLNSLPGQSARSWLARLFVFHPTPLERARRLEDERSWGRSDLLFIGALAFLAARIEDHIPATSDSSAVRAETITEMLEMLPGMLSPMAVLSLILGPGLLIIAVLHVYRVMATQAKLGVTLRARLPGALPAFIALFIGTLLGALTSWPQIARLSDQTIPWTLVDAADSIFNGASLAAMLGTLLVISVALIVPLMLRKSARAGWRQLVKLLSWTFLAALLLQVACNVAGMGIGYLMGGNMAPWEISWLPRASAQDVPGFPSLLQIFLIATLAVAALQLLRLLPDSPTGSQATKVEPSWLLTE